MLKQVIDYYRNEALPLAEEQIQATNLAYKLGSIDYVQFIQNLESAITTKQDFLKQQAEYLELSAQLKYITGK
jgi:cobalt-zinc-cadmium resistance protein CzcA